MRSIQILGQRLKRWDTASIFIVGFAMMLGIYLRLSPVLATNFPLNDGGLFYVMVQDLLRSDYHLPAFTSYNGSQIPFSYPPLSFYLAAAISNLNGITLIDVLRFFPAITSVLVIPAFYLLAREMLGSKAQAGLAVLTFTMLPRTYEWLIMGGGLTRSPGYFFATLAVFFGYRMIRKPVISRALIAGVFVGLTILSHPEMSLFVGYTVALLTLFYNRTKAGIGHSLLAAGVAGFVASPWWLSILVTHGPDPFLSALQTGHRVWFTPGRLLMLDFSAETYLSLIGVAGLLGVLACFIEKRAFLPIWSLVIALISPRNLETLIAFPLAMMAAVGIERVVLPGLKRLGGHKDSSIEHSSETSWAEDLLQSGTVRVVIGFFILYTFLSASLFPFHGQTSLRSLPVGERIAMEWAAWNTPETSRYLVIGAADGFWGDQSSEWFPALSNRVSVATVQGYEWIPSAFYNRWLQNALVQLCAIEEVSCLEEWAENNGVIFSHVYMSRRSVTDSYISIEPLLESLNHSSKYELVYNNSEAIIYVRRDALSSVNE